MIKKQKTVGLALGGGGARGCAHIGVIKALQEADIPVSFVAGTSIGAFIGGILTAGDMKELEDFLVKIKWNDVIKYLDPVLFKNGLFDGKRFIKLIEKLIPKTDLKYAHIPYIAVATNLLTGKETHMKTGNIAQAIRASVSIPGIFTPAKKGNQYFIDGGVVNPLPINIVRNMGADIVIAVDLNHSFIREKLGKKRTYKSKFVKWITPKWPTMIDVIENSVFIMQDEVTQKNLIKHKPDILLQPMLGSSSLFDFHHAKKLINIGYKATKKQIPKIKRLINR
jgi:NTE family protein